MSELWERVFADKRVAWGPEPTVSARSACEYLVKRGAKSVLIPGVGYGRNARPFLDAGLAVTGIEISATAIALAREELKLDFPIHHGSVVDMPFDDQQYDAVFAHGLAYLLDDAARAKFFDACFSQLVVGGHFICTLISKTAPMYGRGPRHGPERFEPHPGVQMTFFDEASVQREFAARGLIESFSMEEPSPHGAHPFITVICRKG